MKELTSRAKRALQLVGWVYLISGIFWLLCFVLGHIAGGMSGVLGIAFGIVAALIISLVVLALTKSIHATIASWILLVVFWIGVSIFGWMLNLGSTIAGIPFRYILFVLPVAYIIAFFLTTSSPPNEPEETMPAGN